MITAIQFLSRLENRGFRCSLSESGFTYTSENALNEEEGALLRELESDITSTLAARQAAEFSSADIRAQSPLPSQTQVEWWNWRKSSPIQLCDEKLSIMKHIN